MVSPMATATTMSARVEGGRLVLPPEALDELGVHDGEMVQVVISAEGLTIRRPRRRDLSKFVGIARTEGLPRTTDEYMREIRPR